MGVVILASFLVLLALGVPVAISMGLSAVLYFIFVGAVPMVEIPHLAAGGIDSFPLLAIPFFILAGSLMNTGGVTVRLVRFAMACVGQFRGGLGHTVITTNMVMAGMSGSAAADCAATGSVLIPSMIRAGYSRAFSAAITGAASTIGPIIPPSIPFVIYGSVNNVSTGSLFIGGIIPGILMGIYLMAANYFVARRRSYGSAVKFSWAELLHAALGAILPMLAPLIIVGGIIGGFFTCTEAAVVCCVYAFLLGVYYREFTPATLWRVFEETATLTGMIMFILGMAAVHGWIVALERIPDALRDGLHAMTSSPVVALLIINLIILFLGCIMDGIPINIIFLPVFLKIAQDYGVDPVHFGVFAILNIMIGTLTPPVGTVMYISMTIADVRMDEFTRELVPFLAALLLVLFMVTYFPPLSLFLPSILMPK